MKTIYSLLIVFLLLSCKNESPNHSTTGTQNPINEELTNTRNYETDGNFEEDSSSYEKKTDSINENWNLNSPERQMRLYERFEMSDTQQEHYEKAIADWFNVENEDPYIKLSTTARIDVEADILKEILDEDQYKRYRSWAKDND